MKTVIITDSHGKLDYMLRVVELESPTIIFFAGDYSDDCIELQYIKESIKYYIVKGNTDFNDYITPEIVEIEINKEKIFLTHGHLFGVKRGYNMIKEEAVKRGSSLVIFGHTHIPYIEKWSEITFFNPGAMKDGNYGVITFEDEIFKIESKTLF
jgi:uncharacterized protein